MTEMQQRPIECLLPFLGIVLGLGLGVFFAVYLPNQWRQGFEALWFPRWLGIIASLILWSMFTIFRGKRLHCGGTEPTSPSDRQKYLFEGIGFFIGYTILLTAYYNALTLPFVLVVFLFIVVFVGEIGWGNPFHAISALSRKWL